MLDFAERVEDTFQLMHCCDCGYQCAGLERCLYYEMYETMFVVARNFHDSLFYFYLLSKRPHPRKGSLRPKIVLLLPGNGTA